MRGLIILVLLTLVVVGLLAVYADGDQGMVVIQWGRFGFESSLILFAGLLLGAYFLTRVALVIFALLWRFNFLRRAITWLRVRRAQRATARGFAELAEGEWEQASISLERAAPDASLPLANYVEAARAANEAGNDERRDALIAKADEALDEKRRFMGLSQADVRRARLSLGLALTGMQRARGQWQAALTSSADLVAAEPKDKRVLRMRAEVLEACDGWDELQALSRDLRRSKALDEPALVALEARIWANKARASAASDSEVTLADEWKQLGRKLRRRDEFVAGFVAELIDFGDHELAATTLREQLGRSWNATLLGLYGRVRPADLADHLAVAQQWRDKHPNDAALLAAIGHIALDADEADGARQALEASLQVRADAAVENDLARAYLMLDDREAALRTMQMAFDHQHQQLRGAADSESQARVLRALETTDA